MSDNKHPCSTQGLYGNRPIDPGNHRQIGLAPNNKHFKKNGYSLKYGLSVLIVWLCPVAAYAMADLSDIFQPYVSNTVTYIDNLFYRSKSPNTPSLPNGYVLDDVMNQATVGSAVNYDLGRQLFRLNLSVTDNRFVNNTFMDNISSNNRAAWNWQLGRQLSGDVGYAYSRAMGGFTNTSFYGLNIITRNNAFAGLNYAWHPRWKARANLSWLENSNSASYWAFNNQQNITALVGLNYTTPSNNSSGLQYSYIDGKYPDRSLTNGRLLDNKYQQHSIIALLTWKLAAKTNFVGNVGYVSRINPDYSQRDYSGGTFDLTLNWTPTAKVMLALSGFRRLNTFADVQDNFVIVEGVSVSPMWQVSPKLTLMTKFMYQTWDYSGDPGIVTTSALSRRQDTILNGQVSLVYTPVPNAEISLGYQGAKRDSNTAPINPADRLPYGYDYAVNSVFCSAMLKF